MPYAGLPENKTEKIDRCVASLMADPKFKSKDGQDKKSAAIATCISSIHGNEFVGEITETKDLKFSFGEGEYKSEIEVLKVGEWDHPQYGKFKIVPEDLDKFAQNFSLRKGVPIDVEHNETGGAYGWVKKLFKVGEDTLKAVVEWTKEGADLIKEGKFRFFSPEFNFKYEDPESRETYENVLIGGALTNRPYFKGLAELVLSEHFSINNEKKKGGEIKVANDEKRQEVEDKEVKDEGVETPESSSEQESEKPEGEKETEVKASEKVVSIKASELDGLKNRLETAEEQASSSYKQLRKMKLSEQVASLSYSEVNPEGVVLGNQKNAIVEFAEGLNDNQSEKFFEILGKLPKGNLFAEVGGAGDFSEGRSAPEGVDSESFELSEKAKKLADDKGITFREAVYQLSK